MNKRNLCAVPDLTVNEIISYFNEFGFDLQSSDIMKPTAMSTQRLYSNIINLFGGYTEEFCDDSLQIIKLVQKMGSLLSKIGIQNFTIKDLVPESKRLIKILSPLINFGMYRDNKKHVYDKVSKIEDDNYIVKKELEIQLNGIKDEMEEIHDKLSKNLSMKAAMESEIVQLEEELKEFYKHQKDKVAHVAQLKKEKVEMGDELCSYQLKEHNLKQEITCLKTRIVNDPTMLLELIGEMRVLIENEKEAMKSIERGICSQNAKLTKLNKVNDQINKISLLLSELNAVEAKIEKMDESTVLLESSLKNWDSRINATKIRINHIDRQISHLESKIFNLQSKDKKCSEEISSKMSNLKIKYEAVNSEREQMLEKVRANSKLVQEIMYQTAKIAGEHERECSEIAGLLVQLKGQVNVFFSDISPYLNE
jgi:kinetochore protein Nuf2